MHEEHVELGISGDHLVWLGHHQPNEPSSWGANHFKEAIMYFDGSDYSNTAGYLLENDYDYHYEQLQINGNQVAWAANYPDSNPIYQDLDIYGYDLGASQNPYKQITQDDSHCFYPTVSPNESISFAGNWDGTEAGAANVDIFRHQGGTTSQLNTQPAYLLSAASDTHTAWYQVDGGVLEVVQHNGLSPSVIPNTGPVVNVYGLEASGDNVAWIQSDGQSYDVRLFDGNNTNIVSNGSVDHARDLDMSGDRMTWATKEGQTDSVMFYDGLDAHEIFSGDFSIQNTGISGANLTWSVWGREYDTDEEIYAASYFGKWAQLKDVYAVELDLKDLLMTGAYMQGADLTGSDLSRTYLYEALLVDAILSSATVEGTDFSNADLTGVIGLGDTVGRAKYSLGTTFPEDFDPVAAGWENLGVVPEPGTALLVVIGLIAMAANGRRRRGLEIRNAS